MTLSTNVAVRLPAEHNLTPRIVLDKLIEALIDAGGPWEPNTGGFFSEEYGPPTIEMPRVEEGDGRMGSVLGQGFHAVTDIRFNADGSPLHLKDVTNRELYPEDYADDDAYADKLAYPACTYLLDMDTAYAARYSVAEGAKPGVTGCTSLHAYAIGSFNKWVVAQGGTLMWENEYRGTWHDMTDEDGWTQFAGDGGEAKSWFNTSVKPAIAALVAQQN